MGVDELTLTGLKMTKEIQLTLKENCAMLQTHAKAIEELKAALLKNQ